MWWESSGDRAGEGSLISMVSYIGFPFDGLIITYRLDRSSTAWEALDAVIWRKYLTYSSTHTASTTTYAMDSRTSRSKFREQCWTYARRASICGPTKNITQACQYNTAFRIADEASLGIVTNRSVITELTKFQQ